MEFLINVFYTILYQPLFNFLILLYQYLPGQDFGVAVIVLTLSIRFLFYPLGVKAIRSQKALAELQPKIKEVQEKFKNDRQNQARAMMELYRKEKINPFSGCLPLLVQMPILFAIFHIFRQGFGQETFVYLYHFVSCPGYVDTMFFGIIDLGALGYSGGLSIVLTLLTGIAQFFQTKMLVPRRGQATPKKGVSDFSSMLQKQMLYFMPVFTVFILLYLPSALALYWLITSLFTIGQQHVILKKNIKK